MNAEGGTLVIGIADDGTVLGIENDFKSLKRPDKDGFEQVLRQVLIVFLGPSLVNMFTFPFRNMKVAVCALSR